MKADKSELIIYQSDDGRTRIETRLEGETVWLTQAQMAELFQKGRVTITEHIRNIFAEGELDELSVCRKFRHTAADGKSYDTNYYNLDVIISVGYRVRSLQGTRFRIFWIMQEPSATNKRSKRPPLSTLNSKSYTRATLALLKLTLSVRSSRQLKR